MMRTSYITIKHKLNKKLDNAERYMSTLNYWHGSNYLIEILGAKETLIYCFHFRDFRSVLIFGMFVT